CCFVTLSTGLVCTNIYANFLKTGHLFHNIRKGLQFLLGSKKQGGNRFQSESAEKCLENLTTSRQSSTKSSEGWGFLNAFQLKCKRASLGHSSSTLCSVSAPLENNKCSYLLVIMILLSVPKQSIHPADIINVNKNLFSAQSVPYRIYTWIEIPSNKFSLLYLRQKCFLLFNSPVLLRHFSNICKKEAAFKLISNFVVNSFGNRCPCSTNPPDPYRANII
ncbi:hypothetical protein NC652_040576, partial [Populus alba x Populus x berolinensis]